MDKLAVLQRMARRWGGDVVVLDGASYHEMLVENLGLLLKAPFIQGHCIDWEKRTVYVRKSNLRLHAIIHEMGHLFATNHRPDDRRCDELTWLGWEYTIARNLRIVAAWRKANVDYGMGYLADSWDMGDLDEPAFRRAMDKALRIATKRKIVCGNRVFAVRRRKAAR